MGSDGLHVRSSRHGFLNFQIYQSYGRKGEGGAGRGATQLVHALTPLQLESRFGDKNWS